MVGASPLKIIHCFRSPVGGIFRHVRDLVSAQAAAGHSVGILCDSSTGGVLEEALFDEIRPRLALGLHRFPMDRHITPADLVALSRVYRTIKALKPDILHSHGAKGGAYARLIGTFMRAGGYRVARIYCPHGGSIHYDAATVKGRLFFGLEAILRRMTDRLIFVSKYEAEGFAEKIGTGGCPVTIAYNGLAEAEFEPVANASDAADFLYIGMMRDLKGPDVFLEAIALLRRRTGRDIRAQFIGDGPDKARYESLVSELGLNLAVTFQDPMPARKAFALARIVVVPSRAESMPYIVLEAVAASKPVVATAVGGIPEIFEGSDIKLVAPGNVEALADAMIAALDNPDIGTIAAAEAMRIHPRFSVAAMTETIEKAYRATL
jgi:glycosyltransferase involved in cell wall biosynthesis